MGGSIGGSQGGGSIFEDILDKAGSLYQDTVGDAYRGGISAIGLEPRPRPGQLPMQPVGQGPLSGDIYGTGFGNTGEIAQNPSGFSYDYPSGPEGDPAKQAVMKALEKFEAGGPATKNNSPGAMQYTPWSKKHGATKGAEYKDHKGVMRNHAVWETEEAGRAAHDALVDLKWEKAKGDPATFYADWSRLDIDSETVQNFAGEVSRGLNSAGYSKSGSKLVPGDPTDRFNPSAFESLFGTGAGYEKDAPPAPSDSRWTRRGETTEPTTSIRETFGRLIPPQVGSRNPRSVGGVAPRPQPVPSSGIISSGSTQAPAAGVDSSGGYISPYEEPYSVEEDNWGLVSKDQKSPHQVMHPGKQTFQDDADIEVGSADESERKELGGFLKQIVGIPMALIEQVDELLSGKYLTGKVSEGIQAFLGEKGINWNPKTAAGALLALAAGAGNPILAIIGGSLITSGMGDEKRNRTAKHAEQLESLKQSSQANFRNFMNDASQWDTHIVDYMTKVGFDANSTEGKVATYIAFDNALNNDTSGAYKQTLNTNASARINTILTKDQAAIVEEVLRSQNVNTLDKKAVLFHIKNIGMNSTALLKSKEAKTQMTAQFYGLMKAIESLYGTRSETSAPISW